MLRLSALVAVLLAACLAATSGPSPTIYGKGVGVGETVSVADLLVRPDA